MTTIGDLYNWIYVGKASTRDPKKGYNPPVEKAEDWKKVSTSFFFVLVRWPSDRGRRLRVRGGDWNLESDGKSERHLRQDLQHLQGFN